MTALPILMYHSIGTRCAPAYARWMVSPDRFAQQLGFLRSNGYQPVTMSALGRALDEGRTLGTRTVAVTFDDGLKDFADCALPVLEQYGFSATLFVTTDFVGATSRWLHALGEGDRPMLSWPELTELRARGIEMGAHTGSHPQLDLIPRAAASDEILRSKRALEDHLHEGVVSFAYPYGYATQRLREIVRAAGFLTACRVRHALSSPNENPFALSRIIMTETVGEAQLAGLLEQGALPVAPPADRFASPAWRLVRRIDQLRAHREIREKLKEWEDANVGSD